MSDSGSGGSGSGGRIRLVKFDSETKEHDGLGEKTGLFNRYISNVFSKKNEVVTELAKSLNVLGLVTIQSMLADLIWRCDRNRHGRAVVLPRGGGCSASIKRKHVPFLVSHVEYLETVIRQVRTIIGHKEREEQQEKREEQKKEQRRKRVTEL